MIRRPPRSTLSSSSAASDVYKRQKKKTKRREEKRQGLRAVAMADSLDEVLDACEGSVEGMPADAVAHAIHCVATRGQRERGARETLGASGVWAQLLERAATTLPEFEVRHTSKVFWALAKLRSPPTAVLLRALEARIVASAHLFDPMGVSNVMWSFATLQLSPAEETADSLGERIVQSAGEFSGRDVSNTLWANARCRALPGVAVRALHGQGLVVSPSCNPQELSNILWSCATLAEPRADPRLITALHEHLEIKAPECAPQHVCNVLWSCAKTTGAPAGLLTAMLARALACAPELKPQGVAQLVWALGKLGTSLSVQLLSALVASVQGVASRLNNQECSNILWAVAVLRPPQDYAAGEQASTLYDQIALILTERAIEIKDRWNAPDVAHMLWAMARLGAEGTEPLPESLRARVGSLVHEMRPSQAAHTLWAMSRLRGEWGDGTVDQLLTVLSTELDELEGSELAAAILAASEFARQGVWDRCPKLLSPIRRRVEELSDSLELQAVGQIDIAVRTLQLKPLPEPFGLAAVERANSVSVEQALRMAECGVDQVLGTLEAALPRRGRILLTDPVHRATRTALKRSGFKLTTWNRFCSGSREGKPWVTHGKRFAGAVVFAGGSRAALQMSLAATAVGMSAGAPLVVICPGGHAATAGACFEPLFRHPRVLYDAGDGAVVAGLRTALVVEKDSVESWSRQVPIATLNIDRWVVFPGLFADGAMDVMTGFLLAALPPTPEGARILDFACGSGTIGATLTNRRACCRVHMLDADSVAIRAARLNVPTADFHLSDGGPSEMEPCSGFDWVVSNPPVHNGKSQDYTVLQELVRGTPDRVVPGGVLWIVAQVHVPVGCIMEAEGLLEHVEVAATDGRFAVWRCTRRGSQKRAALECRGEGGCTPRKKKKTKKMKKKELE
eukprot:TRINITY_DN29516_c0_g1_i3.p1 TRINITY_DN29516_c0_g1~~TRINITY_DN29516_c0_g1_i3.p1  ORF type:complete len:910 (-),score=183.72 TRINITY_DN29516_c0_g1_i3:361-3090(-)